MYMYKWKYLIHYIKPLGALRGMLIIKRDFENIGYYTLELQIINLASGYGVQHVTYPICGMLNNYKRKGEK